jgi:hypothetical protein
MQIDAPGVSGKGGVIVGPNAMPYEIETAAELVRGRRIGADRSLLVCPATPGVYRLAQRRGWIDTIMAAGGSVLDVGFTHRMGAERLLDVAAGESSLIYCSHPISDTSLSNNERVRLATVRTAIEQLDFLF